MTKRASSRGVSRRDFLAGVSLAAMAGPPVAAAGEKKIAKKTFTFKTAGELEIKADVYRADDDVVRPVAIWIHGGALIMGSRAGVSGRVKDDLLGAGYVVVSIDYRLAPETKLPAIIEDVEDAYRWVHQQGPKLFGADTRRMVVLGGSAGGYLTLTCGFRAKPKPAVLVAFWGYGDLVGDWYSKPSAFYRKQPLVSEEEALRGVSGPPVADSNKNPRLRGKFYLYCRQNGLWPKLVSGFDPNAQRKAFEQYEPVRNVGSEYPPTLLIHGTTDTDVPYEQSVLMQRQFEAHGVLHKFITVEGAGHGLAGGDPKLIDAAYREVLPFVRKYVEG